MYIHGCRLSSQPVVPRKSSRHSAPPSKPFSTITPSHGPIQLRPCSPIWYATAVPLSSPQKIPSPPLILSSTSRLPWDLNRLRLVRGTAPRTSARQGIISVYQTGIMGSVQSTTTSIWHWRNYSLTGPIHMRRRRGLRTKHQWRRRLTRGRATMSSIGKCSMTIRWILARCRTRRWRFRDRKRRCLLRLRTMELDDSTLCHRSLWSPSTTCSTGTLTPRSRSRRLLRRVSVA